ncbi:hypothetical protein E0G74_01190 [Salmonella enterica]|nr:hypothetical protein [Salmonella enterica]
MQTDKKKSDSEVPFPTLFNDKKLISKVVPIFNVMHDTALTDKEAQSFLDLLWRYACDEHQPKATSTERYIVAEAEKTVVQEIRRYYDKRPFILDFDGIQISITAKMTITEALMAGMNATLNQVVIEPEVDETPEPEVIPEPVAEPVKHRKQVLTLKKSTAPALPADPGPTHPVPPEMRRTEPEMPPRPEDDEPQDEPQYAGLQTYGVNPGEVLSRAVARVWPLRPALLSYNGKTIPITAEMTLIDAQCEAADVAEVNGNQEADEPQPTISPSGRVYHQTTPYDIARFDYPIPVDDSRWNISLDRNSGADYVRTNRSVWLDGYPYRISCVPFEECMNTETMFYVHCRKRPDQEMFDVYHRLFTSHTHKVHVRKSNGDGEGSKIITNEYCSWRPKEGLTDGVAAGNIVTSVMEALGMNARWEQGARYRIRYWDTNVNCVNHRYYSARPNEAALNVLRHPKLKPVIQTRPAGI